MFLLVVPNSTTFEQLSQKVDKKLWLCTRRKDSAEDQGSEGNFKSFRLRYKDEDGDYITITGDDDLPFVFQSDEASVGVNRGPISTITLYVD